MKTKGRKSVRDSTTRLRDSSEVIGGGKGLATELLGKLKVLGGDGRELVEGLKGGKWRLGCC